MLAADYAKALYQAGGSAEHLRGLKEALRRRGHLKLLPRIFTEYQKLLVRDARLKAAKKITPHGERTRILLELYRTLVSSQS